MPEVTQTTVSARVSRYSWGCSSYPLLLLDKPIRAGPPQYSFGVYRHFNGIF